jgi:hypothetical protein
MRHDMIAQHQMPFYLQEDNLLELIIDFNDQKIVKLLIKIDTNNQ